MSSLENNTPGQGQKAEKIEETDKNEIYQSQSGRTMIFSKGEEGSPVSDNSTEEEFVPKFAPANPKNPDGKYVYMENQKPGTGRQILLDREQVEAFQKGKKIESEKDFVPNFVPVDPKNPDSLVYMENQKTGRKILLNKDDIEAYKNDEKSVSELSKAENIDSPSMGLEDSIENGETKRWEDAKKEFGTITSEFEQKNPPIENMLGDLNAGFNLDDSAIQEVLAQEGLKDKIMRLTEDKNRGLKEIREVMEKIYEVGAKLALANEERRKLKKQKEIINSSKFLDLMMEQNNDDKEKSERAVVEAKTLNEHQMTKLGIYIDELEKELSSYAEKI